MTTETVKIPTKEELLKTEQNKEVSEIPESEYSPEEERALDDGWVPKDQWKGDPKDWRPAKEFNDRGELFNRIKSQSKELADLKEAMVFLTKKDKERELASATYALNNLKAARDAALEEGDAVRAARIGDQLEDAKNQVREVKQAEISPRQTGPSETFTKWHEKNSWYMKDEDATVLAEGKGERFRKNNPNSSEADMLDYVTKEVQKVFPDKFPKRSPPSPNGGGRENPRGRNNEVVSGQLRQAEEEMTDEQRTIMKTILKSTGMTKEEYLKQYSA